MVHKNKISDMGKKVIKLTEKDLESLVNKIIQEGNINEELPQREKDRKETQFRKSSFQPYQREEQLLNVFGPYKDDITPNVISYMRKNPSLIIKRLADVYGKETILRYLGM